MLAELGNQDFVIDWLNPEGCAELKSSQIYHMSSMTMCYHCIVSFNEFLVYMYWIFCYLPYITYETFLVILQRFCDDSLFIRYPS